MEQVLNIGQMALYIKESLKKVKKMELENIFGMMGQNILENGIIIIYLEMEFIIFLKIKKYIMENGKII